MLVVAPFGLLFGTVGTDAGLSTFEVVAFSVLVIAGASQFAALQLLIDQAPVAVALLTGLAVNPRMAMYSASLMPYLAGVALRWRALAAYLMVDQVYALSVQRFMASSGSLDERLAYYLGCAAPVVPSWYLGSWLGAEAGQRVPEALALDFAVPITFIAMVAPMLMTAPAIVSAIVAVALSLLAVNLPFDLGIIVGGVAGTLAGVLAEQMRGEHS